jgi:hypothetical protein
MARKDGGQSMKRAAHEWLVSICFVILVWLFVSGTLQVDCEAEPDRCAPVVLAAP